MSTEWKLILEAQSSTRENTESLAAALITDCEINFYGDTFSIEIVESKPTLAIFIYLLEFSDIKTESL